MTVSCHDEQVKISSLSRAVIKRMGSCLYLPPRPHACSSRFIILSCLPGKLINTFLGLICLSARTYTTSGRRRVVRRRYKSEKRDAFRKPPSWTASSLKLSPILLTPLVKWTRPHQHMVAESFCSVLLLPRPHFFGLRLRCTGANHRLGRRQVPHLTSSSQSS